MEEIKTIKDGGSWFALLRVKDPDNPTGIHQIVKEGKTKEEAVEKLKQTLTDSYD